MHGNTTDHPRLHAAIWHQAVHPWCEVSFSMLLKLGVSLQCFVVFDIDTETGRTSVTETILVNSINIGIEKFTGSISIMNL